MNDLSTKNQYINQLMELCVEKKIHPTELQTLVSKTLRSKRYKGDTTPVGLVLETHRRLRENYPGGWM